MEESRKSGKETGIKRTPISYYGGKQMMTKEIVPMIPEHVIYVEPFFGGGAIFFAKPKSLVEVINDINREVFNFYLQIQKNFDQLQFLIEATPHSRTAHAKAALIYDHPDFFTDTERAWAFWVQINMSFGCQIHGGFGYDLRGGVALKLKNKKALFSHPLRERMALVTIENHDALKVITSRDSPETFFYCDSPYPDTDLGHYGGYTMADFINLLETLSRVKGKFLISSYPYPVLDQYIEKFGWKTRQVERPLSAAKSKGGTRKKKVEVLTWNY